MLPRAAMNSREVVPMRDSDHIQNSAGIPQSPSAAGDFDQRRSKGRRLRSNGSVEGAFVRVNLLFSEAQPVIGCSRQSTPRS